MDDREFILSEVRRVVDKTIVQRSKLVKALEEGEYGYQLDEKPQQLQYKGGREDKGEQILRILVNYYRL